MAKYVIHPGTGTIVDANECVIVETDMVFEELEWRYPELIDHEDLLMAGGSYLENRFTCEACLCDDRIENVVRLVIDEQQPVYVCRECAPDNETER